ncbi:MAG: site-2 protease family protein [Oscillospiraceae bacterium]
MYILLAILVFGILIAVHELGHFLVAKACGVRVDEFAIGMGPAIWKKQKGETLYTVRCLPIGGFCAMAGEDEAIDDPRAFTSQPAWKRFLILCAGAFMNFVFGLLLLLIVFAQAKSFSTPTLTDFMDGCPYQGRTPCRWATRSGASTDTASISRPMSANIFPAAVTRMTSSSSVTAQRCISMISTSPRGNIRDRAARCTAFISARSRRRSAQSSRMRGTARWISCAWSGADLATCLRARSA